MNQKLAALIGREVMREEPRYAVDSPSGQSLTYTCRFALDKYSRLYPDNMVVEVWPDYPGDMAQAWRVVLRMRELGWVRFRIEASGIGCHAEFIHENPTALRSSAFAKEPGDATCLAALAALGVPYEPEVEHAL